MRTSRKKRAKHWKRTRERKGRGPEIKLKLDSSQLSQLACLYAMPQLYPGQSLESSTWNPREKAIVGQERMGTRNGWEKSNSASLDAELLLPLLN